MDTEDGQELRPAEPARAGTTDAGAALAEQLRPWHEALKDPALAQEAVLRGFLPNYDLFFFEVLTRSGIKMLHEMKPGERGSLVVTTPILARYRIGDTILALRPPYFRCIGRESNWWTTWDYYWREFASLNLGRL